MKKGFKKVNNSASGLSGYAAIGGKWHHFGALPDAANPTYGLMKKGLGIGASG